MFRFKSKTAILTVAFLLGLGWVKVVGQKKSKIHSATKFDEFGSVRGCDLSARLDNFAIQLLAGPETSGHVLVYAPAGEISGSGNFILSVINDYLVNSRGLEPGRLKSVYAGRNSDITEPRIQLWVVPNDAPPPPVEEANKTQQRFQGMVTEFEFGDSLVVREGEGPGVGIGSVSFAAFVDTLKKQNDSVGYVVGYNADDAAPDAWRTEAESEIESMKAAGIEASRLKIVFGGASEKTKLQLWITASNAPPPVQNVATQKPLAKSVSLDTLFAYDLADAKNERLAFTRIANLLRSQPSLRLCLVLRIATAFEEAEPAAQPNPDDSAASTIAADTTTNEPEPRDLAVLIQKWRTELSTTHKIPDDRVVVLISGSKDEYASNVTVWLIPPHQPLPDPNANEEEDPETLPNSSPPERPVDRP